MKIQIIQSLDNNELSIVLLAIGMLLLSAHLFGYIFSKLHLPRVIGEITGGVILGPSCMGYLFTDFYNSVFNAFDEEGKLISMLYWIGLILLMFISGYEIKFRLDSKDKKIVIALLLGSTIIPFISGWVIPNYIGISQFLGEKQNIISLKIVIAIAIAVTSIPVISRIFIDLNIIKTNFAKIVLAAATAHDVILWVALAVATGLVSSRGVDKKYIISNVLIVFVFFGVALIIVPKLIKYIRNSKLNIFNNFKIEEVALSLCFLFVTAAAFLNVSIIYGAFLAGITLGTFKDEKYSVVRCKIKDISIAFFIPIYFAIVGLKLDLVHYLDFKLLMIFLVLATVSQLCGTMIAVKAIKMNWLSSFNLAVAMNTRGGPGIVLASVTYDAGIINQTFFVILVLIAIITSLLAGFWLRFIISHNMKLLEYCELEDDYINPSKVKYEAGG